MKKLLCIFIIGLFCTIPLTSFAESTHLPSGLTADQTEKKIDQIMEKYIGKDIPGAAFAIVKDGEVLLQKGYGMSDIENEIKVDPEKTVFEAGSISKPYTWSAVMQMAEQGKLDLNKDIREYLPDNYLELDYPQEVTMLDLMNHTAGFEDKADQLLTMNAKEVIPLKDFVSKKYSQPDQVFPPGKVTAYSNFGASLAGYIIEHESGKDYANYMQEHVLDQLEMEHSSFASDYTGITEIADFKGKSYEKKGDQFNSVDWAYVNDAPAGSLNTTIADMAKFMLAQLGSNDYQLFEQAKTLEQMHEQTHQFHDDLPGNAHGFWERYVGNHRVLEHSGNVIGYTSQLTLVPEENLGFALLMNVGNEMSGLRVDLIDALVGEHELPNQITESKNDQKVEGTYRMTRGIYTNFLKLLPVLSSADVNIKQHDQGGITLSSAMDAEPIHYTETQPLLYERVDDTVTMMNKAGMDTSRIAFELDEKDNVTKMSYGVISDYQPVLIKDRSDLNLSIMLISVLTFISYALVLTIRWFIQKWRKQEKAESYLTTGLLSSIGLFTALNTVILLGRYISNPFQKLASLNIHVWINWLLPVAIIVSGYLILKKVKKAKILVNIVRLFLLIVSCIFLMFLINFNLL